MKEAKAVAVAGGAIVAVGHGVGETVGVRVGHGVGVAVGVNVAVACIAGSIRADAAAGRGAGPVSDGWRATGTGQASPPNTTQATKIAQPTGTLPIRHPRFSRLPCWRTGLGRWIARTQRDRHSQTWAAPGCPEAGRPTAASPLQG